MDETERATLRSNVSVRITLRAPRVAVVVEGDEFWKFSCARAIRLAAEVWGGAGFVVLPSRAGELAPTLLRAAIEYDPDYVVYMARTLRQNYTLGVRTLENFYFDGRPTTYGDVEAVLDQFGDDPDEIAEADLKAACDKVFEACAPYREPGREQSYFVQLRPGNVPDFLVPAKNLRPDNFTEYGSYMASDAPWRESYTLVAAMRFGMREWPQVDDSRGAELPEQLYPAVAASVYDAASPPPDFVRDTRSAAPPPLTPFNPSGRAANALDNSMLGLTWVTWGSSQRQALLVCGDTAEDFALAMCWDRTRGVGAWLPSGFWQSDDQRRRLSSVFLDPHRQTWLASESMPARDVAQLSTGLGSIPVLEFAPQTVTPNEDAGFVVTRGIDAGKSYRSLAVTDWIDKPELLPIKTRNNVTCLEGAAPFRAPQNVSPFGPWYRKWEVDLTFEGPQAPSRGALPSAALLDAESDVSETWVRQSRIGISYHSHRYGYVPAGAPLTSILAQPRLRKLDLAAWVKERARSQGLSAELSDAGKRVELLSSWVGGRAPLRDAIAEFRPLFQKFQPAGRSSEASYAAEEGMVIRQGEAEGYLRYAGIARGLGSPVESEEVASRIEPLLIWGILRRGLVLHCSQCGRPNFFTIDAVGNFNTCPRCGSVDRMLRQRWKMPNEPAWYYDLHPIAREVMRTNGDVPLLASQHLAGRLQRFQDVAEMNFNEGGRTIVEADLIAVGSSEVVVGEVKKNGALASTGRKTRDAAEKKVRLARRLRADRVLLATSADKWVEASVRAVKDAINATDWPAGASPRLDLLSGLGSKDVSYTNVLEGGVGPWTRVGHQ